MSKSLLISICSPKNCGLATPLQLANSLPRSDQWRQQIELVWIDSELVLRSLPWPESVKAEWAERLDTTVTGGETGTAFTGIVGTQQPITSTGPPVILDAASQTATVRSKMLSGPSHTLPALSSISLKYLQSFLAQRPQPGDEDEDDKENGVRDQDSLTRSYQASWQWQWQ